MTVFFRGVGLIGRCIRQGIRRNIVTPPSLHSTPLDNVLLSHRKLCSLSKNYGAKTTT